MALSYNQLDTFILLRWTDTPHCWTTQGTAHPSNRLIAPHDNILHIPNGVGMCCILADEDTAVGICPLCPTEGAKAMCSHHHGLKRQQPILSDRLFFCPRSHLVSSSSSSPFVTSHCTQGRYEQWNFKNASEYWVASCSMTVSHRAFKMFFLSNADLFPNSESRRLKCAASHV